MVKITPELIVEAGSDIFIVELMKLHEAAVVVKKGLEIEQADVDEDGKTFVGKEISITLDA
jgi:hypothetical protein